MRGKKPRTMAQTFCVDESLPAKDNLDKRSDLDLIAAINNGDAGAFDVLYFRYRGWVANLAYRFTTDNDASLDVLQETFIYVLKKFPGFRLTANFKTFLYPAVRNLSIAARRKAQRYQSAENEQAGLQDIPGPETTLHGQSDLHYILASLSEEHQEVLLLRFVDGLRLAEIAEALSIPTGTVKSRLHNALDRLRNDPRTKEFFER
jgi:RNA polymerase sigma-70 factor (ECF subfamily)